MLYIDKTHHTLIHEMCTSLNCTMEVDLDAAIEEYFVEADVSPSCRIRVDLVGLVDVTAN